MGINRREFKIFVCIVIIVFLLGVYPLKLPTAEAPVAHAVAPQGVGNNTSSEDVVGIPYDGGPSGDNEVIWSPLYNPHYIEDNYTVESGWTLVIQPGCIIKFQPGKWLIVQGFLSADGGDIGITFTSNLTTKRPGDWGGIYVDGGWLGSMNNCIIEYSTDGVYIWNMGMMSVIQDCKIHHNLNQGVYLNFVMGGPSISNCEIYNSTYGVYSLSSSLMMNLNNVYNNTYGVFLGIAPGQFPISPALWQNNITYNIIDGVYVDGEHPSFSNNYISFNGRHGICIYDDPSIIPGFMMIQDNKLENNTDVGIWVDGQAPSIIGNTILNCSYGIYADQNANPWVFENNIVNRAFWGSCIEFHGSKGNVSNSTLKNGKFGIYAESSEFNVYRSTIEDWGMTGIMALGTNGCSVWVENTTMSSTIGASFFLDDDSHVTTLNTSFDKGTVDIFDGLSNITVNWWVHIKVNESNGDPANGAQVWLNDTYGITKTAGITDSDGWIKWIQVTEYVEGFEEVDYDIHAGTAVNVNGTGITFADIDFYKIIYIDIESIKDYPIQLYKGWNMISLPFVQSDHSLGKVLESIDHEYNAVQWFNISDTSDHWKHFKVDKPFGNDMSEINHYIGIWIYSNLEKKLLVKGERPITTDISLFKGWNFVGYPSLTTKSLDDALSTIAGKYDAIYHYDASDSLDHWKSNIDMDLLEIRPGEGYWVHALEDCICTVEG